MRKLLPIAPMLMALAMATGALAQSTGEVVTSPQGTLNFGDIAATLSQSGLKLTKLELDDGLYEAEGIDAAGAYVKVKVDPRTGSILSRKVKN